MRGNQKGVNRETLTLDVADNLLTHIEQAIEKAGGVYLLTKDLLRVNVSNISTIQRSQPTGCAHSAIKLILERYNELAARCEALIPLFYTSKYEFKSYFKTKYSLMHRHFEFDDEQLVSTNIISFLLALLDSGIARSDLQDLVPVSVTDKLRVDRLSLPGVMGFLVLSALREFGVYANTSFYNSMILSARLTDATSVEQLKDLAFVSNDLISLEAENNPLILKDWVQADSYIIDDELKGTLNKEALINSAVRHFSSFDVLFSEKLRCQLNKMRFNKDINAVMLRDIANALYIVYYYEMKRPDKSIPLTVAYTLGAIPEARNKSYQRLEQIAPPIHNRQNHGNAKVDIFMPTWDQFIESDLQLEADIVEMEKRMRGLSQSDRALLMKMVSSL